MIKNSRTPFPSLSLFRLSQPIHLPLLFDDRIPFSFILQGNENSWQVWSAEFMTPLANTNLHLLQEGAFSSNAFSFPWGWGPGQYDGPTWNAHFYRYSRQKEGRKKIPLCVSEVLFLDAWVSYVISNHPSILKLVRSVYRDANCGDSSTCQCSE